MNMNIYIVVTVLLIIAFWVGFNIGKNSKVKQRGFIITGTDLIKVIKRGRSTT